MPLTRATPCTRADWLRKHLASSPARAQADRLRASMAHRAGAACVVERYSLSKGDEHVVLASQGLVAEVGNGAGGGGGRSTHMHAACM